MKEINWFDVPETEEIIMNTSYYVLLRESDIKYLDRLLSKSQNLLKKRSNARSSIIKLIVENTYLYLNNMEREFESDLNKILSKSYYKDIDSNFKKKLLSNKKEYDLFKELVRNQVLKTLSVSNYDNDEEELIKVQFRLAKDDYNLVKILEGAKCQSQPDYIASYISYFMSFSGLTRHKILHYPNDLMIDRAIKDRRCIIMNNMKFKPYKIASSGFFRNDLLVGFNDNNEFVKRRLFNIDNVVETNEYFEFNTVEREILDSYFNLDTVVATFTIESDDFLNILKKYNTHSIISSNMEETKKVLTFKYNDRVIRFLDKAYGDGKIKHLCYSDEYQKFMKLVDDYKNN